MILAIVGMKREAALLARVGVRALVGGGDAARLADQLNEALASTPTGPGHGLRAPPLGGSVQIDALLSFGVAGGLDPLLEAGDIVVASGVVFSSALSGQGALIAPHEQSDAASALEKQGALGALSALHPSNGGPAPEEADHAGPANALEKQSPLSPLSALAPSSIRPAPEEADSAGPASALEKQSPLSPLSALAPSNIHPAPEEADNAGPASALEKQSPLSPLSALHADPAWVERLAAAIPGARRGLVFGHHTPVSSALDKAGLFATTGTLACDMESHLVAAAAARHGLPFAVVRAVSDPVHRDLPAAALAGFGADGEADVPAVLRALARDPRQLPALIRTGVEAEAAFRALGRAVERLEAEFGFGLTPGGR